MRNKLVKFLIITVLLFVLSALCFRIMKIGGDFQGMISPEGNMSKYGFYYFNIIFGILGLILYNIIKIIYDKMFNKIYTSYITKGKRVGMILLYIWISLVLWVFVFLKSNIGGGLTNLYQFKIKFLQGVYIIDILFVLPLWNFVYNIYRSIRKRIMMKKM